MDANFFYYSIYDRFIQRQPYVQVHVCVHLLTFYLKTSPEKPLTGQKPYVQVHVCVHLLTFYLKTSPEKPLTGLLPNFIEVFLR